MRMREKYLGGVLLVLIGMLIGTLITLYQMQGGIRSQTEVKVTEFQRSTDTTRQDVSLGMPEGETRSEMKNVANQVIPTVVYIESVVPMSSTRVPDDQYHEFDDDIWDRFFSERKVQTVGSGVIISTDGFILTNNHVVEGAERNGIRVVLNDKRSFQARLVGTDPTTDLAVLKIDERNLPAVMMGNSDQLEVGEWVLAVGNPFRLRSTVTAGIVSALNRDVQIINENLRVESFIQTDAAINKGNSGGALVNTSGELIGINTAIASRSGSYQGYGFAVPINLAMKVARDLIEYGEVKRAFLGISMRAVTYDRSRELGLDKVYGVEVVEVVDNSAAAANDIRPGDVILSVNGRDVQEANELQEKVAMMRPGEVATLKLFRNQQTFTVDVKLRSTDASQKYLADNNRNDRNRGGSRENESESNPDNGIPDNPGPGSGVEFGDFDLGFRVMGLSKPDNPERFDLIITRVDKSSEAWNRGLREGFLIEEVDEQKVEDLDSLKDLVRQSLEDSGSVMLKIRKSADEETIGYFQLERP